MDFHPWLRIPQGCPQSGPLLWPVCPYVYFLWRSHNAILTKMPHGYALAERRRARLPRSIYTALTAAAQQIVERQALNVIRSPARFFSPAQQLALQPEPKRLRATPPTLRQAQEEEMSQPGFPLTGGGGFSSVSYFTDKAQSNARQLAKLEQDTGRYFNMDNGMKISTSDYGDQTYATVTGALLLGELQSFFQQANSKLGLDDAVFNTKATTLYVRDLWMHIDIVNSTNVSVYLEIYDVRPRDNIPGNAWPHDFVYAGLETLTTQTEPGGLMMTDPFMSREFTTRFHVYKTHKVILAPGEYHTHRVHWAPNRLISRTEVLNLDSNINQPPPSIFERLSYFTMIRHHGAPVIAKDDTVVGEFATYSKTKLGICWWSKVQFQVGFPFADDLLYTDNLITPVDAAETVRPDGTVVNVENAEP